MVRRSWEEAVHRRRLKRVDELVAADVGRAPGWTPGPAGKRRTMTAFLAAFPDLTFTIERRLADEERYLAAEPVGRFAAPEEVAAAAVWLCSDAAAFVTEVALPVDGGWVAR